MISFPPCGIFCGACPVFVRWSKSPVLERQTTANNANAGHSTSAA